MNPLFENYFAQEKAEIFRDYFTFLRFKSLSADPAYRDDLLACAHWLYRYLETSGLKVEQWQTAAAPVLFAHDLRAGPSAETLLIYCHYDVQPVDPLEEWLSPPFEPTLRGQEIYARGASDNKGQCFYTLTAIKAFLKLKGHLPVNLKFIIEGEEESGSRGLAEILPSKKEALSADHLLVVDSGLEKENEPVISLGVRGLIAMQFSLQEAHCDLHSGSLGGLAYNPNRALVDILARLHDERGSVAIPGFYEGIVPLTAEEKKELSLDFNPADFKAAFGFEPTGMEEGISPNAARWLRPTLEINGIWGGYTGPGFKTVIPAKAYAKLSCRLVPYQDPAQVAECVRHFLLKAIPPTLRGSFEMMPGGGPACRTRASARIAKLLRKSYSDLFQKPCQCILMGGSIPISVALSEAAGAEMVFIGVSLPTDHIHSPNERFSLERFQQGFLTLCHTLELMEK